MKAIEFLLEHAGPVIQYRLRKEIQKNLSADDEEKLLGQIYEMPLLRLLETYVKPDGYIGSGMHSWDNWRGTVLHETPLQDGESAARLLSYYRIPKTHPIVKGFVSALRDEEILRQEFSYIPPEIPRYERRFEGLNNGNGLMTLIYTMQAMLGFGDDYEDVREFQQICLKGFQRINEVSSLDEITKFNPNAKRKYNYPYIEADDYFPDVYTLAMLAYTKSWRTDENIEMLADALNHINAIMKPDSNMHVRLGGKYVAPCFAFVRPIQAFDPGVTGTPAGRRVLSEIAMLGVGEKVGVIRESAAAIRKALEEDEDGILRPKTEPPSGRKSSSRQPRYPGPYGEVSLEADYKDKNAELCDLTFWAVEFLHLLSDNLL